MPADQLPDVLALDILHRDEMYAFNFIEIENGADVGMVQKKGKPRFAFKAFKIGLPRSQLRRQNFDDDGAAKFRVGRFVDCALPAHTELFQNAIVMQGLADHEVLRTWYLVPCT